jgi:hypothetical protein
MIVPIAHVASWSNLAGNLDGVLEPVLSQSVRRPFSIRIDVLLDLEPR